MKRSFFLCFLLAVFPLHAQIFQNHDFHVAIMPTFAYSSGILNESIYHSTDPNKKISLLEWERNLWLYGVKITSSYKKFHFDTASESSLPLESGEMRDSDWLNTANYAMKTTYSVGQNTIDKNFDANLSIYYDFELARGFYISPKIQAQYAFDSFYRKKGDSRGWYGQSDYSEDGKNHWWYEDEAAKYPSEYYWSEEKQKYVRKVLGGIDYYRHSVFLWSGFDVAFKIARLKMDFSFMISPYTYLSAEDRHHTSGDDNVYHHIQSDFFTSFRLELTSSYELSEYADLVLNCEFLFTNEMRGDLYEKWHKNTSQASGGSTKSSTARLGVRVKIF